jgi:hypothetical protein
MIVFQRQASPPPQLQMKQLNVVEAEFVGVKKARKLGKLKWSNEPRLV